MLAEFLSEESQQRLLDLVARPEVGMSTFGCGGPPRAPVPKQERLPEAGPRRDHCAVPLAIDAAIERVELLRRQMQRAERGGLEIVHQPNARGRTTQIAR